MKNCSHFFGNNFLQSSIKDAFLDQQFQEYQKIVANLYFEFIIIGLRFVINWLFHAPSVTDQQWIQEAYQQRSAATTLHTCKNTFSNLQFQEHIQIYKSVIKLSTASIQQNLCHDWGGTVNLAACVDQALTYVLCFDKTTQP